MDCFVLSLALEMVNTIVEQSWYIPHLSELKSNNQLILLRIMIVTCMNA